MFFVCCFFSCLFVICSLFVILFLLFVCLFVCDVLLFVCLFLLQANAFRNAHKIYVSGPDVPDAVGSFAELQESYKLPTYLRRNITAAGYTQPTPIQMQAIPLMLHVS